MLVRTLVFLFVKGLTRHLWPLMSCAAFTLLGVYAAWTGRSNSWFVQGSIALAVILFVIAAFLTWRDEHDKYVAADAATRALMTTHPPRIDIKSMSLQGLGSFNLSGRFVAYNTGGTRAIFQRHYSDIIVAPVLPVIDLSQKDGDNFTNVELRSGEFTQVSLPAGGVKMLSVSERNALENRIEDIKKHGRDTEASPTNLFAVGWIKFLDEGGVLRNVGFCKKYNFLTHRFQRESDEDYEYGDHGYTSDQL
jgi:hypothetical protein